MSLRNFEYQNNLQFFFAFSLPNYFLNFIPHLNVKQRHIKSLGQPNEKKLDQTMQVLR